MSYDMSFKGSFDFPTHQDATAAVDAFSRSECIDECVVQPEDLHVNDRTVRLDVDASAPATWWESTCAALETLSQHAVDGSIEAVYDGGDGPDTLYRVRLLPGGEEEELDDA